MCGFVGIVGSDHCAAELVLALQALQHRGQDSAGVATINDCDFPTVRKLGLVGQSFTAEDLEALPGSVGIGHVRYPTIGSGLLRDTQPFWYRQPGVLMAHNGNLINVPAMEQGLADESVHLMSRCDIEPALCLFSLQLLAQRKKDHSIEDAIAAMRSTLPLIRGAYSLVAALRLDGQDTLLVLRDPLGIRPAVWGRKDDTWIVTSESVALDALGAELMGDVAPGELMILQKGKDPRRVSLAPLASTPCVFEYIYFARPDSQMNGQSVYAVRLALGQELAAAWKTKGLKADVVIPIPDTSRPSANAMAEALSLPFREGFIKNRYTGRTFIMPSSSARLDALKLKLNPIKSEFTNRRVLIVDDSIVRGTTLKSTIRMVREQNPREVHLAIHSPPVLFPCYYGIDMSTREELVAVRFSGDAARDPKEALADIEQKLAARLGLDSLTYLPIDGLARAFPTSCCAACFTGVYPLPPTAQERGWIEDDRRHCIQRELSL